MTNIGVYDAKTHLPQLLKRVAKGERITITKHGVPVAVLHPPEMSKKRPAKETIAQLRAFGQNHRLNGLSLKEMIEAGRP